ncbi:hypothetical protein [Paenibacillus shenyangensis]|uniref:hypothetical protein n=1 Tax=Paenibacillus sp. A9 TaxID=1284352 RepID=UPI00036C140B|nr:hypothetical protein [Paenibacillus sp. A9]
MKSIPFVNSKGFYIEDKLTNDDQYFGIRSYPVSAEEGAEIGFIVGVPAMPGLYTPRLNIDKIKKMFGNDPEKWTMNFTENDANWLWVEGATEEEIKDMNPTPELTELEKFKHDMAEQIAALWDFNLSGGA